LHLRLSSIEDILTKLFDRFNFTVSESTPLDLDVAVDAEILGKVFEELVTNRHGSGSYYTPKQIVAFRCRETLKGYLKSKCAEDGEKIDRFVVVAVGRWRQAQTITKPQVQVREGG
jgi:hypothetical protein